jgi:hypothetical protein
MGLYIGDVFIPFVSEFSPDDGSKPVEVIKHITTPIPPVVAEFQSDVRSFTMSGMLYQEPNVVKTIHLYSEDVLALRDREGAYNLINDFDDRTGFLIVTKAATTHAAKTLPIRSYDIAGLFLSLAKYKLRYKTYPTIRPNPWSMTLGSDDCNNYVAIPIGGSYSGGDGSTITRTGEDGVITLVKATSDNNISFEINGNDVDAGEVKVFDDMNTSTEANWNRVHSTDHKFEGMLVVQNGLFRVKVDPVTNEYLSLYHWDTFADGYSKIDDYSLDTEFSTAWFTRLNGDNVVMKLSNGVTIEVTRGHPIMIDTGSIEMFAVNEDIVSSSATSENYIEFMDDTYVCSDAIFSTVAASGSIGTGKKWIFYDTSSTSAEDTAHICLVDMNLRREITGR